MLMRILIITAFVLLSSYIVSAQNYPTINPENITIIRDTFGVPHIFAKTDAEVGYGFAWANAEDAFHETQSLIYLSKGYAGRYQGMEGVKADFFTHAIRARKTVEEQYDTALSPQFKKYLNGFVQGLNAYAAAHPEKVKIKKAFPITEKDIMTSYVVMLSFLCYAQNQIGDAVAGKFDNTNVIFPNDMKNIGSNAYAVSPIKSADGKTYLCINPHLQMNGILSFYEAHLQSEEGLMFTGASFQGALSHAMGTNPHLGWAYTWNYFDRVDAYKLKMINPKKLTYDFDGKTLQLEKRPVWLKVKIKGLTIPVRKMTYWSIYGATVKSDKSDNFYAVRFGANQSIKGGQQLYEMSRATNREEFWQAVTKNHTIPLFNMVYADDKNNIAYVSQGALPDRKDQSFNWESILPGNTAKTLWTSLVPIDSMPHVYNPSCGWLLNTNNNVYSATCNGENDNPNRLPKYVNQRPYDNNRAATLHHFFNTHEKVTFEDFKAKKFDWQLFENSNFFNSFKGLWELDLNKYPDIADFVTTIRQWDRKCDTNSREVACFGALVLKIWDKRHYGDNEFGSGFRISEDELVANCREASQFLIAHFGSIHPRWGDIHRMRRGDKSVAANGFPDLLSPTYPELKKIGDKYELNSQHGDTYTMFVKYGPNGAESIESLQPLGNAINPESPYYTDQMDNFVHIGLKKHSFDKNYWLQKGKIIYHPK